MEIQLSEMEVGFLTSLVTEVFKLVPWLRSSELTVAATAVVINCIGIYFFTIGDQFSAVQVLAASLVSYKMIIQPAAKQAGLVTQ